MNYAINRDKIILIENEKNLNQICKLLLSEPPVLSIDTEFSQAAFLQCSQKSSSSYNKGFAKSSNANLNYKLNSKSHNILSIIQISSEKYSVIVDTISCKDLTSLAKIMEDKQILKIFHASKQDIILIKQTLKVTTQNIFDTQIAAKICGIGDCISYKNLCKTLLNIKLNKNLQKVNWLKRPINNEYLLYAISDTKYLFKLYSMLLDILIHKNLLNIYEKNIENLNKFEK